MFKFEVFKYLRNTGSHLTKGLYITGKLYLTLPYSFSKGFNNFSDIDKINMAELRSQLDNIYKRKAEGAFIRSRKRWLEEGE